MSRWVLGGYFERAEIEAKGEPESSPKKAYQELGWLVSISLICMSQFVSSNSLCR